MCNISPLCECLTFHIKWHESYLVSISVSSPSIPLAHGSGHTPGNSLDLPVECPEQIQIVHIYVVHSVVPSRWWIKSGSAKTILDLINFSMCQAKDIFWMIQWLRQHTLYGHCPHRRHCQPIRGNLQSISNRIIFITKSNMRPEIVKAWSEWWAN